MVSIRVGADYGPSLITVISNGEMDTIRILMSRMFGYAPRFGVTHVDRDNGYKRTPKDSTGLLKSIFAHLVQ